MLGDSEIVTVGMDPSPSSCQIISEATTLETPRSQGAGEDEFYHLRFLEESSRLFKRDTDELEFLFILNSNSGMLSILDLSRHQPSNDV